MPYEKDRGSARHRGYDARWDKAAKQFKVDHPLCCGCEANGRIEPATVVDHIEPHRGDQARFWDQANWQSSCDWCHNAVKPKLEELLDLGLIDVAGLRLDSPQAIEIAKQTPRKAAFVGSDGWPVG